MLQKGSMEKTMEIFFQFPTKEHYLMDISRMIKVAHTSVKKNLQQLVKARIIQERVEKKGSRKFPLFIAHREDRAFQKKKQLYNLAAIMDSGLIKFIEEELMPNTIVLFGSYQRGEDVEESDIDLFVECKKKDLNIKKFEKKLQRSIQLHFKEHFTSYPAELKNNIINGVVFHGFLEGFK